MTRTQRGDTEAVLSQAGAVRNVVRPWLAAIVASAALGCIAASVSAQTVPPVATPGCQSPGC